MVWNSLFFVNSIMLGAGLAMDAFSVSVANGLAEPYMKKNRMCLIAGTFAFFQAIMPIIGWICVHTIVTVFASFDRIVPWIAFALLAFIGIKMIVEGIRSSGNGDPGAVGSATLLVQGIATSIDALSVGFAIADYMTMMAIVCALIISAVTFVICMAGLIVGKKFGSKLTNRASVFGGIILIIIGLEILISGI